MAGKGKKKEQKTSRHEFKDFLKSITLNIITLSAAVGVYYLIVRLMQAYSGVFYPLQVLEAKIVYIIQSPFTDVAQRGAMLLYQDFAVEVVWDCLGIRQSLFFLLLVFSFYQVNLREKLRALWFVPVIIIANIARIAVLYPMFVLFGAEKTAAVHEFMYAYGNGIFILLLFVLWFYVFGLGECKKKRK